jgi:hypothetical protein
MSHWPKWKFIPCFFRTTFVHFILFYFTYKYRWTFPKNVQKFSVLYIISQWTFISEESERIMLKTNKNVWWIHTSLGPKNMYKRIRVNEFHLRGVYTHTEGSLSFHSTNSCRFYFFKIIFIKYLSIIFTQLITNNTLFLFIFLLYSASLSDVFFMLRGGWNNLQKTLR